MKTLDLTENNENLDKVLNPSKQKPESPKIIERLEDTLRKRLDDLSVYDQDLTRIRQELTIEVEELRNLSHGMEQRLTKAIKETIKEAISSDLPEVIPYMTDKIVEKTESAAKKLTKDAETLQTTIAQTIKDACQLITQEKEAMTRRKMFLVAAICLCSVGTALSISYFYPTHYYTTYQMTEDMAHSFFVGESMKEMSKEFTPQQKERLEEIILKKRRIDIKF